MSHGPEATIFPATRALGIGITAYGVLSRGLLSGIWSAERVITPGDFRAHAPRFAPNNVGANLALVDALTTVAATIGVSVAEVAMAWAFTRGDHIAPSSGPAHPCSWLGCRRPPVSIWTTRSWPPSNWPCRAQLWLAPATEHLSWPGSTPNADRAVPAAIGPPTEPPGTRQRSPRVRSRTRVTSPP